MSLLNVLEQKTVDWGIKALYTCLSFISFCGLSFSQARPVTVDARIRSVSKRPARESVITRPHWASARVHNQ